MQHDIEVTFGVNFTEEALFAHGWAEALKFGDLQAPHG